MVHRPVVGEVRVEYSQIYVESGPDAVGPGLPEAFAGQNSGLCGAAVPGALWLHTGLHTGSVGFCVEVHDQAPHLDPAWEDVVEASFRPASAGAALVEWGGGAVRELGLREIDYRVRYCARGMDEARRQDTRLDGQPQVDRYLLQFWPGEPAPDRILKQTTAIAAYWHDYARRLPAPPSPAERAEAERRARLAQERAAEQRRLALELREWGGQSPSRALRAVGGNVRGLLDFDPALVHAIDAAGAGTQRAVARLAAHRACEAAGLDRLDWVSAGLVALVAGRPLPPPLDDPEQAWRALAADPRVPDRTVGRAVPPRRPPFRPPARDDERPQTARPAPARRIAGPAAGGAEPARLPAAPTPRAREGAGHSVHITLGEPDPGLRMSQPHMALPALLDAAAADPLRAALDAVYAGVAAYGEDYPALLDEVRSLCQGA
ncbi:hypothetical protein BSZ07_37250 [Streptomyces sp. M1013]|uniref:hypothetical protein n=1 Tax=Streptomyces sp. M1013 TaxID=549798 RepID=UPI00097903CA|nr:hypothetical protein [Streptomyces sp. M1013]OMI84878.1 hypothetical protein BSZ07_37250 [Streptomyces sp. M1013]